MYSVLGSQLNELSLSNMIGDGDTALDDLKYAVAPLLDGRPDVVVSASRTRDGTRECLALTVEPAAGRCRDLRMHSAHGAAPRWAFTRVCGSSPGRVKRYERA